MANLIAPKVKQQAVSVTRKMAASLPGLREIAKARGLKVHHLGAGYPHPEVTDPRGFLQHQSDYFDYVKEQERHNDPNVLPEYLRESYSYTDTLGPQSARETFAHVYGQDWNLTIDPQRLIPTVGASGGISLACSLFERSGEPLAYITDAPTYAGFTARASLCVSTQRFSVWKWTLRGRYQSACGRKLKPPVTKAILYPSTTRYPTDITQPVSPLVRPAGSRL